MRKLGIVILIIVALVVIAALVVPPLVNINRYHDQVQAQLQKRLGRPVSLGQMRLSVLPLAIRVDNAVIGEDPAFHAGRPFAGVQELDVRAKLWPLLHGDVEVQSLNLRKPQIELVRNQQGAWNFASLGQPVSATALPQTAPKQPAVPAMPAPSQPSPSKPSEVSIADLKIEDGQIALTDLQKHQPRAVKGHSLPMALPHQRPPASANSANLDLESGVAKSPCCLSTTPICQGFVFLPKRPPMPLPMASAGFFVAPEARPSVQPS